MKTSLYTSEIAQFSSQGELSRKPQPPLPLIKVEALKMYFPFGNMFFGRAKGTIQAVDGIDFAIPTRRSLALVGESGCGKTTTGKLLTRLYDPTSGHIYLRSENNQMVDLAALKGSELKRFRRRVQMIFQDPYELLNPRASPFSIPSPNPCWCRG